MYYIKKLAVVLIISFICSSVNALIKLPAIIGDNMVLQQNIQIPVWGWGKPYENVAIKFRNKLYKTIVTSDGKWSLELDMCKAGGPYEMQIKGPENQIHITNILIGDVWVASGQSNMEFGIQTDSRGNDAIENAKDSMIRFFYVPMATSLQLNKDISSVPAGSLNGKWIVCSPEIMKENWAWHGFSAVGYYFAKEIRRVNKKPIGMIGTYKGGTSAQAWISITGLQKDPILTKYILAHQKLLDNFEGEKKTYSQHLTEFQNALKQWDMEVGKPYEEAMIQWKIAVEKAHITGVDNPLPPQNYKPKPQPPISPEGGFNAPANLFNAMVAPIIPFGIKGVIWYQGESNGDKITDACEYSVLFSRLIMDWREKWGKGDFPFLFVQLANFRAPAQSPSEGIWPWIREAQLKTLSLKNTGMAVTSDIGDPNDIHPKDKYDVGMRLALTAFRVAYGKDTVFSGPIYDSMTINGNSIKLKFKNCGTGLILSTPPWTPTGIPAMRAKELKGFAIAGADMKFVWAKAVIEDNVVVVNNEQIKNPIAVRYNWADNPNGNLYNNEGLPASSFRTDTWPCITIIK
jgi:sialate O-acetylesterase